VPFRGQNGNFVTAEDLKFGSSWTCRQFSAELDNFKVSSQEEGALVFEDQDDFIYNSGSYNYSQLVLTEEDMSGMETSYDEPQVGHFRVTSKGSLVIEVSNELRKGGQMPSVLDDKRGTVNYTYCPVKLARAPETEESPQEEPQPQPEPTPQQ
jgi:hypothetical protein